MVSPSGLGLLVAPYTPHNLRYTPGLVRVASFPPRGESENRRWLLSVRDPEGCTNSAYSFSGGDDFPSTNRIRFGRLGSDLGSRGGNGPVQV